jgi:hypothetical protein
MGGAALALLFVGGLAMLLELSSTSAPPADAGACIAPLIMGDFNGDRGVDSSDALWILRLKAGLFLPDGGVGCSPHDMDCNGNVNAIDALKILRYTVGRTSPQIEPCVDVGSEIPP